jgi:uncharacterized protein (DUF433 family)
MTPTADLFARITMNPDQCGGQPCIRGMLAQLVEMVAFQERARRARRVG